MGKSRRGKRHKSNVKNHGNKTPSQNDASIKTDEVRTDESHKIEQLRACTSGDRFDKSCHSPLHIVDILSSIETPSPKGIENKNNKNNEKHFLSPHLYRPRSNSSISRFSSLMEKSCDEETARFQTPKSSVSRRGLDESTSTDQLLFKTPMTHLRHNLFKENITPSSDKYKNNLTPSDKKKDASSNTTGQYLTPSAAIYQKKIILKQPIHSSTPKYDSSLEKETTVLKDSATNTLKKSLVPHQISPIAKTSPVTLPSKRYITWDFKKYKKIGIRWYPFGVIDGLWVWLRIATRKILAYLKRCCYESIIIMTASTQRLEDSTCSNRCINCKCFTEISSLQTQLKSLQDTVDVLRKEILDLKENTFKPIMGSCGPSLLPLPPPPPPLPPPPIPIIPTPMRPMMKTGLKKVQKQSSVDSDRPVITLDDILSVRLRKTTTSIPTLRKPVHQSSTDVIQKVKLRPPITRHRSPVSTSASPKSSLTRILKNVDTSVRVVRRLKQFQNLSCNDFSRQRIYNEAREFSNETVPTLHK